MGEGSKKYKKERVFFSLILEAVLCDGSPSPMQKKRSILCPPPSCKGERGGWEKGLGDEGEKLASRAFHLKFIPMHVSAPLRFLGVRLIDKSRYVTPLQLDKKLIQQRTNDK
jgi:hypothetical protein